MDAYIYSIKPGMSRQEMAREISGAASAAVEEGKFDTAGKILKDGVQLMRGCFPDDPEVERFAKLADEMLCVAAQ
jgi:hypothetical protein